MKYVFTIVFDKISEEADMTKFVDVITSHFVSKRGKVNLFLIITEIKSPKEIYEIIDSKLKVKPSFVIMELTSFYGNFIDDSIGIWLGDNFPKMKLTNPLK